MGRYIQSYVTLQYTLGWETGLLRKRTDSTVDSTVEPELKPLEVGFFKIVFGFFELLSNCFGNIRVDSRV